MTRVVLLHTEITNKHISFLSFHEAADDNQVHAIHQLIIFQDILKAKNAVGLTKHQKISNQIHSAKKETQLE